MGTASRSSPSTWPFAESSSRQEGQAGGDDTPPALRYPWARNWTTHGPPILTPACRITLERTLSEIAERCGAALEGDGSLCVVGPADLERAGEREISFLGNPLYAPLLASTRAAGVLVAEDVECARDDLALLRVADPSRAFTEVIRLFVEEDRPPEPGVDPAARVHASAQVGAGASIGPFVSIGAEAVIGEGCVLHPGVHVGARVVLGPHCVLHPGVVLYPRVRFGERCTVHSGTVVGSDGFGYDHTPEGWSKIPQCGNVIVGNDVEIGANCGIDRARFGATRIADGVKIDNLVHIAHNCEVAESSLLVAQVGISGSAKIGRQVVIAGQAGLAGHISVGDGAQIGGQAGVTNSVSAGSKVTGWPARPVREALRDVANAKRVPRLAESIRRLEERLARLEENNQ